MTSAPGDLPEAARRRLDQGAFSSGLSVSDFAACLEMGLEPVGLVQGFCAMQWGNYSMVGGIGRGSTPFGGSQGGYVENYQCPHGMISVEHRMFGQNYEQTWIEDSWREGFTNAYARMIEEAQALGAHGVVGVLDSESSFGEAGVIEFHARGTAVRVLDAPPPTQSPWSTYLAGQRLAKVFEAGYVPVSIVASVASIRVWSSCVTEYLMEGTTGMWSNSTGAVEIDQLVSAQSIARDVARSKVRAQLLGDALHGASLDVVTREFSKGDFEIQSHLSGNRVRRFKDVDPLDVPKPTVRLS
ncbi:MAG TPA: heavy metal-binding domain-containing protein [Acidimicrobiales bacterium]